MEPGGGTAIGAVGPLLTSSCFRKGAESRRRHRACGVPSLPYPKLTQATGNKTGVPSGSLRQMGNDDSPHAP